MIYSIILSRPCSNKLSIIYKKKLTFIGPTLGGDLKQTSDGLSLHKQSAPYFKYAFSQLKIILVGSGYVICQFKMPSFGQ